MSHNVVSLFLDVVREKQKQKKEPIKESVLNIIHAIN